MHSSLSWVERSKLSHGQLPRARCSSRFLRTDAFSFYLRFLDNDCASHLRVNGAKIGVSTGSARCNRELLIRVERGRFLKLLLDAYNGVRFFVPVNPGHLLSGLHG